MIARRSRRKRTLTDLTKSVPTTADIGHRMRRNRRVLVSTSDEQHVTTSLTKDVQPSSTPDVRESRSYTPTTETMRSSSHHTDVSLAGDTDFPGVTVTRSGRAVKLPERLDLEFQKFSIDT